MKSKDIQIGCVYRVKVSGQIAHVRILRESEYGGWHGVNLQTGRQVRIKSPQRCRSEVLGINSSARPLGLTTAPVLPPMDLRTWPVGTVLELNSPYTDKPCRVNYRGRIDSHHSCIVFSSGYQTSIPTAWLKEQPSQKNLQPEENYHANL